LLSEYNAARHHDLPPLSLYERYNVKTGSNSVKPAAHGDSSEEEEEEEKTTTEEYLSGRQMRDVMRRSETTSVFPVSFPRLVKVATKQMREHHSHWAIKHKYPATSIPGIGAKSRQSCFREYLTWSPDILPSPFRAIRAVQT